MHILDWAVLIGTIVFITVYGIWKTAKNQQNTKAGNELLPHSCLAYDGLRLKADRTPQDF